MTFLISGSDGGTFPSWTTATRPASPAVGQMGYNTTTGLFDQYTAGGWSPVAAAGTVLQTVQTFYKTVETLSTNTWTATGVSASITPKSSSSKILVCASMMFSTSTDNYGGFKLYRNGSEVTGASSNQSPGTPPNAFMPICPTANVNFSIVSSNSYLDSPASTSAQTYTIYWSRTYNSGSIYLNRPANLDTGNTYTIYAPSSITLMEIAA